MEKNVSMHLKSTNHGYQHGISEDTSSFNLVHTVFRDYDIRGIAFSEINQEFAMRLGKALGRLILQRDKDSIYVGRDGRLSSDKLTRSLCEGLLASGCNVFDLGLTTTPIMNFAIFHQEQSCCGVMVTASHNPGSYNGFKMVLQKEIISNEEIQNLKDTMNTNLFAPNSRGFYSSIDILPLYLNYIIDNTQITQKFNLVIDGGNAVAGGIAATLFEKLGCNVERLFCDVDGNFPNHDPNPADEKNLTMLIDRVKLQNADLGIALDGDGDRLVVISAAGEVVWPDRLMMIFAQAILPDNPGSTDIFDVKSSIRLEELIVENSGIPLMSKTGHSHIRQAVRESNAILGGEFSGHIFFNDRWNGFDDGLYAAVRLLELLCRSDSDKPANIESKLSKFDKSYFTPEILIPIAETEKFELMEKLISHCDFGDAQVTTLDGLRIHRCKSWGLIRPSNTTPNLTLRFEADNIVELGIIKASFRNQLKPFIHKIEEYI
jgi:phosphomannomutase/phosphoglucomutase